MATQKRLKMEVEVTPQDVGRGIMSVGDIVSFVELRHKPIEYFDPNPSLPSSPFWTEDMNPGFQPNGVFSAKKRDLFDRQLIALMEFVVAKVNRKRLYI